MTEPIETLERRMDELRAAIRRSATSGDRNRVRELRGELRKAEHAWEEALADIVEQTPPSRPEPTEVRQVGALLPIRDQVHQALTLLSVPAAPKLIIEVHTAFFAGQILGARLTSLRRDEERSFQSAPFARPYYICAALSADLLAPARGLLAVSTWPMDQRIVGPLSPRADFLTAAIEVAERVGRMREPRPAATRLLWRFAANIPGAAGGADAMRPASVIQAARQELEVHDEADRSHRRIAAARARRQLNDAQQLFGAPLGSVTRTGTGS